MKYPILGALSLALLIAAAPVYALTVDEVIGLSRAGASDALIMSKIDADGTVFHLAVAEILDLKDKQVSDAVITYMINTGKTEVLENTNPAPDSTVETPNDQKYSGNDDGGGQVGVGVGVDSYGGVGLSFGYYYPHWPGYSYSYYYDPFWWPSWTYYAGFWQPYPYYYWYSDPWYGYNGYYHGYYDNCYYGGHYHNGYSDGYGNSYADGRNIGNRGPGTGYDRVIKDPNSPGVPGGRSTTGNRSVQQSRQSFRMKDPGSDLAAVQAAPNVIRGQVRRPTANQNRVVGVQRSRYSRQPSPQYMQSVPRGSQVTRNNARSQPAPEQVTVYRSRPSNGQRVERSAPQDGGRSASPPRQQFNGGGRSFSGGGHASSGGSHGGGGFHGGGGGGGGRTGKH